MSAEVEAGRLLVEYIQREITPKHNDRFKEEPNFGQKLIAHFLSPFNPSYMEFHTTLYPTIWWGDGNKQAVLNGNWWLTEVRAHEAVHMFDRKRLWLLFNLLYLGPVVLAPFILALYSLFSGLWGLAAVGALLGGLLIGYVMPRRLWWFYSWVVLGVASCLTIAIWKTQWQTFWIAGAVLVLSPFPLNFLGATYGRAWAEFRGYCMSMAIRYWRTGSVPGATLANWMTHFWGGNYVFMCPWKGHVERKFQTNYRRIESGDILKDPVFRAVYEIMKAKGLLDSYVVSTYPA